MLNRFLVVILASLALACGISLVFWRVASVSAAPTSKMRNVVVATAELPVGVRIRSEDMRVTAVPQELAPAGAFSRTADVKDRVVTNAILKGEPVVPNRLAPPGSAPGLAPMIPPGFRAVSVRVNDVIGVAGFIQPGMRVDVLATGRLPSSEDSVTRTVLQNVVVLSAGQVLQPEPKGQAINAQVVTLQVRPDEAEVLTLTSGEGRIQLVLRNSADIAVQSTPGAHLVAVYRTGEQQPKHPPVNPHPAPGPAKAQAAAPVVDAPPAPGKIEIIRGVNRVDVPEPAEGSGERRAKAIAH